MTRSLTTALLSLALFAGSPSNVAAATVEVPTDRLVTELTVMDSNNGMLVRFKPRFRDRLGCRRSNAGIVILFRSLPFELGTTVLLTALQSGLPVGFRLQGCQSGYPLIKRVRVRR